MEDNDGFKEKRIFTRFPVNIPVVCLELFSDDVMAANTHDISTEGMGLSTDKEIANGTPLKISFQMQDNGEMVTVKGKVAWLVSEKDKKYRVGIKLEGSVLDPVSLVLRVLQSQMSTRSPY